MFRTLLNKSFRIPRELRFCNKLDIRTNFTSTSRTDDVKVENKDQVLWIKLDRQSKYNALSMEMYNKIAESLENANKDDAVKAVVLTGAGTYYSSGNDLKNFLRASEHEDGLVGGLKLSIDILVRFVDSFINLEKFLIAAVNGPAIGIAVTTLGLCDYVIASDKATFQSPFTSLGQSAEGCSSYTFPKIMGSSKASELLLLNKIWNAKQAQESGLVSETIEDSKLSAALNEILFGKRGLVEHCYPNSLKAGKSLIRPTSLKEKLISVNRQEAEVLFNCWMGEECQDAIKKFMIKREK